MRTISKKFLLLMMVNLLFVSTMCGQSKKTSTIEKVLLNVPMHCETCQAKIEKNIAFEKGVKDMVVNFPQRTVELTYDASKTSLKTLEAAFRKLGYEVTVKEPTVDNKTKK